MSSNSFMNDCKEFEKSLGKDRQIDELLQEEKDILTEEQVTMMERILEKYGFKREERRVHGRDIVFYIGGDAVFGVAPLPKGRGRYKSYILVDRSLYDNYFADNKKASFSFNSRNVGDKVKVHTAEYKNMCLHRLVMEGAGYKLDGKIVDHVVRNTLINTAGELRVCTGRENAKNRKFISRKLRNNLEDCQGDYDRHKVDCARQVAKEQEEGGEFAYNPLNDFSNTWYALVLHRMLGRGTAEELKDYNRDFLFRHDKVAYYYYESIF